MEYGIYAGVDVSKESFTVCIRKPNGKIVFQGSFPQSSEGFQNFLNTINNLSTDSTPTVGMESTSIYYLNLFSFLIENNINTVVINPSAIKSFAEFKSRGSKSDRKDASIISEYLLYTKPEPSSKEKLTELKLLSREKEKLSKELSHLKDEILRCLLISSPNLKETIMFLLKVCLTSCLNSLPLERLRKPKEELLSTSLTKPLKVEEETFLYCQ